MSEARLLSCAAVRIQCAYRGYVARKSLQALRDDALWQRDAADTKTRPRRRKMPPQKRYKTSMLVDRATIPKRAGGAPTPDALTSADFSWLVARVNEFDEAKARGVAPPALYEQCKTRLSHVRINVLKNHIKQIRNRRMLKQQVDSRQEARAAECERLKAEIKNHSEEISKTKAQLADAQPHAVDASASGEDRGRIEAECGRLEAHIEALEQEKSKTEQQLAQVEEQAAISAARRKKAEEQAAISAARGGKSVNLVVRDAQLVVECARLKAEVNARDAEIAMTREKLADAQARAAADAELASKCVALTEKIEEQDRLQKQQAAALEQQKQEVQRLETQLSIDPIDHGLQTKLAKAVQNNEDLSKAFSQTSKKVKELQEKLDTTHKEAAHQKRDYEAKIQAFAIEAQMTKEEKSEATTALEMLTQCQRVEQALRKLLMAVRCRCQEESPRDASKFDPSPQWNNATMSDLALSVMGALGSDSLLLNRRKEEFDEWRGVRNAIHHVPDEYKKYLPRARHIKALTETLCEDVDASTKAVFDILSRDAFNAVVKAACGIMKPPAHQLRK